MDCDECKNLISLFLDCELEEPAAGAVRMHLALCTSCARICEDFASILDVVSDEPSDLLPPNSQALWCRINNIIENEAKAAAAPIAAESGRRSWRLSLGQLATAVLSVAIVSSVLTVVAVRSSWLSEPVEFAADHVAEQTLFDKVLGRLGLADTPQIIREKRLRQQQDAIDYWNARVQSRRMMWDSMTREAFDRNLRVIDQSVSQFSVNLERDPGDELSGEMLDSVLDDKMKLLRDFAEL
jgi:hypothetical protein